jgi:hypothetical protein
VRDLTVNRFRKGRGHVLRKQIADLARHLKRPVEILDVGGRAEYWDNVGYENIAHVRLLNNDAAELTRTASNHLFTMELGDACNLSGFGDQSIDLIHSNSVIEHVGQWPSMCAMAGEARRVGRSGWVQTPAWEFPIEPHFKLPFMHWCAPPIQRAMLRLTRDYKADGLSQRRFHVDRINLMSYGEFKSLFPECDIFVERVIVPKSYTARWLPSEIQQSFGLGH